ncbi:MAG TPA: anti-sigma factor antagonist [Candidatus Acidoferrales bacterium]|nr:anti-sigma factor antagonist [Candidatus Acidoferrales bacterium]
MPLELHNKLVGRVVVLSCRGRITAGEEGRALQQEVTKLTLGMKSVVLDVAEVSFVDSGGIGVLVRIFRTLRSHGGDLKICRMPPDLSNVLRIAHLDTIFEMYETEAQAVEAFRRRPIEEDAAAHGPKKKVLCVDESHDVLAYLGLLLRRSGYEVMTAQNVSDFVRFLTATRPHGVLAGHGMRANERVAEALRRAGPQVPVIFLPAEFSTAEASEAGRELVERMGAMFTERGE